MRTPKRISGMAGMLLLVSLFTASKASAAVRQPETELSNGTVQDRVAAIQGKLKSTQEEADAQLGHASNAAEIACAMCNWGDWVDWGDWMDWGDWGDWADWGDWGDWGDLSWSWGDGYWQGLGL